MSSKPKTQGDKANNQTLVLIDGHALAYRAYFALASTGFQTRQGEPFLGHGRPGQQQGQRQQQAKNPHALSSPR